MCACIRWASCIRWINPDKHHVLLYSYFPEIIMLIFRHLSEPARSPRSRKWWAKFGKFKVIFVSGPGVNVSQIITMRRTVLRSGFQVEGTGTTEPALINKAGSVRRELDLWGQHSKMIKCSQINQGFGQSNELPSGVFTKAQFRCTTMLFDIYSTSSTVSLTLSVRLSFSSGLGSDTSLPCIRPGDQINPVCKNHFSVFKR